MRASILTMLSVAALSACAIIPATAADVINVTLDNGSTIEVPQNVATIVIGNPLIADVTVIAGHRMVVIGKSYGTTNIIMLDRAGTPLMEKSVTVHSSDDGVVVHYGNGASNKTVLVRGYTRQNGTHVDSYLRASPGQGAKQH